MFANSKPDKRNRTRRPSGAGLWNSVPRSADKRTALESPVQGLGGIFHISTVGERRGV